MKTIKVNVQGMTCASCEVLLERGMKKVSGVHNVQVSRSKEKATIHCEESVQLEDLQAAVANKGYILIPHDTIETPIRPPFIVKNKERYTEIGAAVLILIALYVILTSFNLIPQGLGVSDNMSYGFIFVIGLVAATSTCLAVAGGLLLAVASKHTQKYPHLTRWQKFKPHMYFNVGRIVSYTLLGGAIGTVGSVLTISPKISGFITILASVLMIIMGVQLLQIFPWLNKIQLKMPKFIAHKIYDASHYESSDNQKEEIQDPDSIQNKITSFLFGGSTFFLPCGFTQALQLYALGKGDFVIGALTMLAFSLGTLPSLVGVGAFSSFTKGKAKHHFMTFSAVLVIVLGLFNMPNGIALAGASFGGFRGDDTFISNNVELIDGFQIARMSVIGLEYYPHKFTIVEDVPVRWIIDGTKAQGCAQVITAPKIGITEFLPRDTEKIIEFMPNDIGNIRFSCTMGMTTAGAGFDVVSNTQGISAATLKTESAEVCDPEVQECFVQKRKMEISREKGFYPNVFEVQKNIPVEIEIDARLQLGGCMGTMVVPKYGVTHVIPKGISTFRFTPTKAGIVDITCSMGNKQAEIRVI